MSDKWRYAALALIAVLAVVYQVRMSIDVLRDWSQPDRRYRLPFAVEPDTRAIGRLSPEAAAAGLRAGDALLAINGVAFRGLSELSRISQPVVTLSIARQTEDGRREVIDIVLKLPDQRRMLTPLQEKLVSAVMQGVMPWLCLMLGIWTAAIRPGDPQAWLLLALILSFPHLVFVNLAHWEDRLRQFGLLYRGSMSTLLAVAMPLFGIYFADRFPMDRRFPWAKWLVIVPAVVSGLGMTGWNYFRSENFLAVPGLQRLLAQAAAWHFPVLMISIGVFFFTMGWKAGVSQNPDASRRLRLLLYGTMAAMTPMFLLILIGLASRQPFFRLFPAWLLTAALLMLFLFPLTITYVIAVHRALDVRVVIRQGIQYALARGGARVLIGLMVAAVVIAAVDLATSPEIRRPQQLVILSLAVGLIILLERLRLRLAAWIDRKFFRQAYDAERILSELSEEVRTMVDTDSLLRTVANKISRSLFVTRLTFLLAENGRFRPVYALGYDTPPDVTFPETAVTVRQLKESEGAARVYLDDENSWVNRASDMPDEEWKALMRLDPQLILPLAVKEKLLGFLSLGEKRSEEPYSGSDLRLLRSLAVQTGLALENSMLTATVAAEAAQRERLNRELEIAREVQERLFPQQAPRREGFDIAGGCRPALGVGGDYYDFLDLPEERLGIVVADVSGKGIAAALLMASLQASVRGQAQHTDHALAAVIGRVNALVYESSASNRYATLFYAQLDTTSRILDYVNAGHNPPILLRARGEVEQLKIGGAVVGLLPRVEYQQGTVQLQPGDLLIAFTDGISEAQNSAEEEWGEERLLEAARTARGMSAPELIAHLTGEADRFAQGVPQHDDMTLVIVRVL